MYLGSNMKKLLTAAKRNGSWTPTNSAAEERAAASLKEKGLVKTKTSGNVVYVMAKAEPRGTKSTARRSTRTSRAAGTKSKFQQAVTYAQRHNPERKDFVTWLRNKLEMTDAGSNTYATAALKAAHAARATRH